MFITRRELKKLTEKIDRLELQIERNKNISRRVNKLEFQLEHKPAFNVGAQVGDLKIIDRKIVLIFEVFGGHHYHYTVFNESSKEVDYYTERRLIEYADGLNKDN